MAGMRESGTIRSASGAQMLDWGAYTVPNSIPSECGDAYCIIQESDRVVVAVADGAGTGAEACRSANQCLDTIRTGSGADLQTRFDRAHAALRGTRGAALAIAHIDLPEGTLEWAAVGDVDGVHIRETGPHRFVGSLVQRGGTVGHRCPRVFVARATLDSGDIVILSTDGICRDYQHSVLRIADPLELSVLVDDAFGQPGDDRLVLALRSAEAALGD